MSTYTYELNKLLKEGCSYDSHEVKTLQRLYKPEPDIHAKPPTVARVSGSQDIHSQLAYHRNRLGGNLTDAEVIAQVNKEFGFTD